jgi:hypothetical protein
VPEKEAAVPEPDLFKLDLPVEAADQADRPDSASGDEAKVVRLFPTAADSEPAAPAQPPVKAEPPQPGVLERITPAVERSLTRFAEGWSAAWTGDGVLGMRPRPVMALVRQFWVSPPPYIADALILRIPYAVYGAMVIPLSAAVHLLLLLISYPSLLAVVTALAAFLALIA